MLVVGHFDPNRPTTKTRRPSVDGLRNVSRRISPGVQHLAWPDCIRLLPRCDYHFNASALFAGTPFTHLTRSRYASWAGLFVDPCAPHRLPPLQLYRSLG